ncbi:MAG: lytic transglycosylase domain-containing protein, partial [Gemmatimonadota bacterium]
LRSAATAESNAARAASHWFSSGRLALAAGDSVSARDDLWRALSYGERVTAARSAARVLDRFPEELSPSDELLLGRVLLADGSWEAAHRRLSPHLQAPGGTAEEAAELRLGIGRALFELGRFIEAEDLLAPLAASTDASDFTLEALFWRGRAALEREALAAAAASFGEIADRAPESGLAGEGKLLLLQRELRSGFGPRARLLLEDLVRTEVRGTAAETLLMELGTLLYLEGDLQGAGRVFEALSAGSGRPAARQQAGYWTGLTLDRGGETTGAAARLAEVYEDDPFSTYGVFAGERVGAPVIDAEMSVGPSPVPGLAGELRNALARLRVHRLVPTSGSFAFELERLTEHFFSRGDGAYDFAEALVEGGFALQAISLGREIRRREDDWNLRLLRIVHPFPYRDIIVREAVSRGVDPFFVAGVIRQESAFDARIVSVSGATGLMQLMAPTAREVASSLGIRLTSESLNDPETNVRLGSTYLSTMLARFDGRAEDALAAYNAGPTRIRQWRGGSTYQDRDVFMEHIPFQETRNYVKVVQQYARIYTALYGCGDFEPCFGLSYPDVVARSSIAVGAPGPSAAR